MTGVLAPPLVPVVNVLAGDGSVKVVGVILAEHENGIAGLFELLDELGLLGSVGEITHGPKKFVTVVGPVEDTREFRAEFADDIDIALPLLGICGVRGFDVLTREVDELHTAVEAVDDLSGGHGVARVNELAPRDEVDVIEALVARLDGCAVGDFQKPLADLAA